MTAGARPRRDSVRAKEESGPATEMSQDPSRPRPPARTWPVTRATTGFGRVTTRFDQRGHGAIAQCLELQLRVDAQKFPITHVHVDQAAHGRGRADLREHAAFGEHRNQAAPEFRLGLGVFAGHRQVVRRLDPTALTVRSLLVAGVVPCFLADLEQQLLQLVVFRALGRRSQSKANCWHGIGRHLQHLPACVVAFCRVTRAQLAQPGV